MHSFELSAARARFRRLSLTVAAALAAAIMLLTGVVLTAPSPASAADHGPGRYAGGFWHGAYRAPDGSIVYCLDPDRVDADVVPVIDQGFTTTYQGRDGYRAIPPQDIARINLVVSKYGQTSDVAQAVAVHAVVWVLATGGAWAVNSTFTLTAHERALFDKFFAEASAYTVPVATTGALAVSLETDANNHYEGSLVIDRLDVAAAAGTITLTNGIFDVTGTNTIVGPFDEADRLPLRGVQPTTDGVPYKITAVAALATESAYAANFRHWDGTGGYQDLAGPGTPAAVQFTATAQDASARSVDFAPAATTQVAQKFVRKGDDLVDLVQPHLTTNAHGAINEWPRTATGGYQPITFRGTAFGPLEAQPVQSARVPSGSPVAGSTTFTTTEADGPNARYTATIASGAGEPGYYTWVWEVLAADQIPTVATALLAPGYAWADDYGQEVETTIVIPEVTTIATLTASLGSPVVDTATVSGFVFDGATIGFEAYRQEVGADGQLLADPMCDLPTLVFTDPPQPVHEGAGEYRSNPTVFTEIGLYFWVETLYAPNGDVLHRGECGIPSETTRITADLPTLAVTGTSGSSATAFALGGLGMLLAGVLLRAVSRRDAKRAA